MTEPLWRLTAAEVVEAVRARRMTARAATESTLARIDAANPALNAIVERLDDEALAAADAVDAAIADGRDPGPLAGAPVTVKINVDMAGRATTNGLRTQADLIAAHDNPVVANLRRAGAVIVGRTNTPAFSLRWFTRNSLHGATRNPRDATLTPGGSSGGAGAAVAAGMGAIAHGTDIAGSIRYPAYACGVHGLRPSFGRAPAVNLSGPERMIGPQLTAVSGPLARSVADLRLALQAMAAPDPLDPWHVPAPLEGPPFERRAALCRRPDGMETAPAVIAALEAAAERLRRAGWVVEDADPPALAEAVALQTALWMAEMRAVGGAPIDREDDPDATVVYERLCALAPVLDLSGMMDALRRRLAIARAWGLFLARWPLLLCPVSAEPPFADHRDVRSAEDFGAVFRAQSTQVGLPLIGVPALALATSGDGPPMGVQLVAGRFREDVLLAAAEDVVGRTAAPLADV